MAKAGHERQRLLCAPKKKCGEEAKREIIVGEEAKREIMGWKE